MLVPRPICSPGSSVDQTPTERPATILVVLGIIAFMGLTYAIQTFMTRMENNNANNRRPAPVKRLVDT